MLVKLAELTPLSPSQPALHAPRRLVVEPTTSMTHVVTEYMQESLHELIHNSTAVLDDHILVSIVKNIAAGMNYLHSMDPPVVHGTLRAVNVLVDLNFTAKVRAVSGKSRRGHVLVLPGLTSYSNLPLDQSKTWFCIELSSGGQAVADSFSDPHLDLIEHHFPDHFLLVTFLDLPCMYVHLSRHPRFS